MLHFQNQVQIDRPVEDVFPFATAPENFPKWNYYVQSVTRTSPGNGGVGAEYHQVRREDAQRPAGGRVSPQPENCHRNDPALAARSAAGNGLCPHKRRDAHRRLVAAQLRQVRPARAACRRAGQKCRGGKPGSGSRSCSNRGTPTCRMGAASPWAEFNPGFKHLFPVYHAS